MTDLPLIQVVVSPTFRRNLRNKIPSQIKNMPVKNHLTFEQKQNEKQLLELLEMAKIVERQMIEVGHVIAAVDEKSAKRIDELRKAKLQKKEVSGV